MTSSIHPISNQRSPTKVSPERAVPPSTSNTASSNPYNNNNNKPNSKSKSNNTFHHHLSIDKSIIDELLLVCGVIGSTIDNPQSQQIIPVEDCLNWLQDLQRALRRDEDAYRPISLLLGQWKIVQQKLVPLVLSCRYDTPLVLTIVKILVILTKPLSDNALKAGRMVIDAKNKNVDAAVIEEQIKLRDNAIAQANLLKEYKKLFVHHPSHRVKKKSSNNHHKKHQSQEEEKPSSPSKGGLLSIFVSLLTEPLSKTGLARSNDDHLTVELILHLFRNLLCAGEPLLKDAENIQESMKLHQELIDLFDRELVLDILLVIGQEMESRENVQYNLLIMEIMHHLLKSQDPTLVARSVLSKNNNSTTTTINNHASSSSTSKNRFNKSQSSNMVTGSLRHKLQEERLRKQSATSSRHSHFGGTLVVKKDDGEQRLINVTSSNGKIQGSNQHLSSSKVSQVELKRRTKKQQHFIGSNKLISAYYSRPEAIHSSATYTGPTSHRAQCALNYFCGKFLTQCYGPVVKSLKDEFRRDSNRLEESDKVTFFRIIWFFCQWSRVSQEEGDLQNKTVNVGKLVFTMDVFTFNFVLTSLDYYLEHKKYKSLAQTVSLYTEMIRLLHCMYVSPDSMDQIMAMGLMDHLFYKQDPLDRLPKLLSKWVPGTFTFNYLCDLVELTHVTLKLLNANEKACAGFVGNDKKPKKKHGKKNGEVDQQPVDRVTRMKETAAEFDTVVYLARKLVSNQVVLLFTEVLSKYMSNSTRINDHVVAFFVRLCKFVIPSDDQIFYQDTENDSDDGKDSKSITLEPMLFNLHLFTTVNEILNDECLLRDKDHHNLLGFASTLVRHYARATTKNPMLFVETLFRHNTPHRYCVSLMNNYVSEELKMIAMRDLLLDQQLKEHHEREDNMPSDDDEEMEFVEDGSNESKKKLVLASNKEEESSDEEQEMEFDDEKYYDNNKEESSKNTKASKEKLAADDGDDEIFPGDKNGKNDTMAQYEVDNNNNDDDDRWNDRRTFKPKRKLLMNEEGRNQGNDSLKCNAVKTKSKRIKRTMIDDEESSDDEDFGDTQISMAPVGAVPTGKSVFDDSDDEDN